MVVQLTSGVVWSSCAWMSLGRYGSWLCSQTRGAVWVSLGEMENCMGDTHRSRIHIAGWPVKRHPLIMRWAGKRMTPAPGRAIIGAW